MTLQMYSEANLRQRFPTWEVDSSPIQRADRNVRVDVIATKTSNIETWIPTEFSIADMLFEACAKAKQWTSSVSRSLDHDTRTWLFRQLDRLHDVNEWFEGNDPVELASYKTFVRAIIASYISGRPALGLAPDGRVVAIWRKKSDSLVVDFFANDEVRYLVTQTIFGKIERFAGATTSSRLKEVLEPFNFELWANGR